MMSPTLERRSAAREDDAVTGDVWDRLLALSAIVVGEGEEGAEGDGASDDDSEEVRTERSVRLFSEVGWGGVADVRLEEGAELVGYCVALGGEPCGNAPVGSSCWVDDGGMPAVESVFVQRVV